MFTISAGFMPCRFRPEKWPLSADESARPDMPDGSVGLETIRVTRAATCGRHEDRRPGASIRLNGMECRPRCTECAGQHCGDAAMPFPMIPAALGVCFLLVWILIGGMIFRDSHLAVESERDTDPNVIPLRVDGPSRPVSKLFRARRGARTTVRAAS